MTHANDKFDTICKIAVVAARPLVFLYTNPPTVELYFNSVDELELDPQQEWIMIEARSGYYEANRHTLRALQKMSSEKFPLAEHIVDLETTPKAPEYVIEEPWKELSPALSNQNQYFGIDVLEDWPELPEPNLDESQLAALRRILTKRLAVVQGPPGTGKTHVSVVALKIMRGNMAQADPPIIVTAQTNHALDQLLRHINAFESNFIRLGGRTADQVVVKPRTLFEIRKASNQGKNSAVGPAMRKRLGISTEIRKMLDPLVDGAEPFTAEFLHSYGLLSRAQLDSLVDYARNVKGGAPVSGVPGSIAMWLDEYLVPATFGRHDDYANLELEEADLAFEQLKDVEVESGSGSPDDDAFELVRGEYIALVEPWTGHSDLSGDEKLEELLKKRQDLWRVPPQYRGSIYRYLQRKAKEEMRKRLRVACSYYMKVCQDLKVAKWERDLAFLREARIIGMTTTGLSKYRGLITSLNPKVVLIEEAAETIEAHVTAACFDTLQHLILVGDHQQLRGHCSVPELERHPWNLAVSLFERLVKNDFEFSQLTRQRRMRPEIRRIINPIYPQLQDHPCVENREDVPGMGGVNSWFHTHGWYESNDNNMSKQNLEEAEMVVGVFDHLVHNGMDVEHITVLTFYNGQRKKILDLLKRHHNFQGNYHFKVATVDSYQGEENEIVLLSLVRNNPRDIGFLSIENRVCVALSRARRGFYIFGNHFLLGKKSPLWLKVLKVLARKPSRIGKFLPIACTNHGRRENITCAADWDHINGGCALKCDGVLACGHVCPSNCHPFPHSHIRCKERCATIMPGCRHRCIEECHIRPCRCQCRKQPTVPRLPFQFLADDPFVNQAGPSTSQAPARKGNAAGYTPEAWKAWVQKEARGQGPARSSNNNNGFGKRKVSFPQPLITATNGTPRHRNQKRNQPPRQTTAQMPAWGNFAAGNDAAGPANGTPHRHNQQQESEQVSAQVQAWGDFAAGGHVGADRKIKDDIMEKVAEADQKRAEEKRQLVDVENERNLFGGDDTLMTQTDLTAAIGRGESRPAQTDLTAADGEMEAEVAGELRGPGTPPPRAVGQADLLQLGTGAEMTEMPTPGGSRVRRVEEWRPASPGSPTTDVQGRGVEEVSLLDMENDF